MLHHQRYMGVSKNNGTPKSSILIGFSIINHPFWDTPIFGNIHISSLFSLQPLTDFCQIGSFYSADCWIFLREKTQFKCQTCKFFPAKPAPVLRNSFIAKVVVTRMHHQDVKVLQHGNEADEHSLTQKQGGTTKRRPLLGGLSQLVSG